MKMTNIWPLARIVLGVFFGIILLAVIGAAGFVWGTTPGIPDGRMRLPAKTPFASGQYFAYVQPWGGEMDSLTKSWAPHADHLIVDLKHFPNNTQIYWRWPPFAPHNGPGVWAYNAVMHGNYDGGETEVPVAPQRVDDMREYRQTFAWTMDEGGNANVLTEIYLRSSSTDPDAKLLEVGWFLHMPKHSRDWFESAKPIGVFVDSSGMRWAVRIEQKFCMFGPEKDRDIRTGTLDMLAALKWLKDKKNIKGDEWLWGVSLGAEAVTGMGHLSIDKWSVVRH